MKTSLYVAWMLILFALLFGVVVGSMVAPS